MSVLPAFSLSAASFCAGLGSRVNPLFGLAKALEAAPLGRAFANSAKLGLVSALSAVNCGTPANGQVGVLLCVSQCTESSTTALSAFLPIRGEVSSAIQLGTLLAGQADASSVLTFMFR